MTRCVLISSGNGEGAAAERKDPRLTVRVVSGGGWAVLRNVGMWICVFSMMARGAYAEATRVAVPFDALPGPEQGYWPSLLLRFFGRDITDALDTLKAERVRYASLGQSPGGAADKQHQKNIDRILEETATHFARKAEILLRANTAVGGNAGNGEPPAFDAKTIRAAMVKIYNARATLEVALGKANGAPVEVLLVSSVEALRSALQEGRAAIAYAPGFYAARHLLGEDLVPVATGLRREPDTDAADLCISVNAKNPVLETLSGYRAAVKGARPTYAALMASTEEKLADLRAEGKKELETTEPREIVGFQPLGVGDAMLREGAQREVDEAYRQANAKWAKALTRLAQEEIYNEFLEKRRKIFLYSNTLEQTSTLQLTSAGMRKLLDGLKDKPMELPERVFGRDRAAFEVMVERFAAPAKARSYCAASGNPQESPWDRLTENPNGYLPIDKLAAAAERMSRPGVFRFQQVLVCGPKTLAPPPGAWWVAAKGAESGRRLATALTKINASGNGGSVAAMIYRTVLGESAFRLAEPASYVQRLQTFRAESPAPVPGLIAKSCVAPPTVVAPSPRPTVAAAPGATR